MNPDMTVKCNAFTFDDTTLKPYSFDDRAPRVGMTVGMTLNTGNYQSVKMSISVEVYCLDDDPTETLDNLQTYLMEQLLDRLEPLKERTK